MLLLLGLLALVALLVQPPAAGQREVAPVVSEDFNDEDQAGIGRILEAGGDGVDAAVTKFSAGRATKRVRRL